MGRSRALKRRRLFMNRLSTRASPACRNVSALRSSSTDGREPRHGLVWFVDGRLGVLDPDIVPLPVGLPGGDPLLHHQLRDLPPVLADPQRQTITKPRTLPLGLPQHALALVLDVADEEGVDVAAADLLLERAQERGPRHGTLVHVRLHGSDARPGEHPVRQDPVRVDVGPRS